MMDFVRETAARLRSFFRRRALEEELTTELTAHLEMSIEDNRRRGMSADEARRHALIQLGGIEAAKELHRDSRGLPWLETLCHDVRYALRAVRRDAALATFAVLIIGLGIGSSSLVFSVVNALVLRPLPFDRPDRLVWIRNGEQEYKSARTVQVAYLQQLQAESRLLAEVAGFSPFYNPGDHQLTSSSEPERLTGVPVTENFFRLLGVQPQVGRLFTVEETQSETRSRGLMGTKTPKTVLLSHRFWTRRFGSDPAVVGRALTIDETSVTVVGVLPQSFDFSTFFAPGSRIDFFSPFPLTPDTNRQGNTLALIGRLQPHATPAAAEAEAAMLAGRLDRAHARNAFVPRVSPLQTHVTRQSRPAMAVLACAVGLVMIVVCANLSNLLLARTASRRREMAVRAALGAGRSRMIQQLLTESVLLSLGGAAVGLLLAWWGTQVLSRLDTTIPLLEQVRVDPMMLGFTLLVAVATGIAVGLIPAVRSTRLTLNTALKEGGRSASEGKEQGRIRTALVVAEVTLACVLLVGAGLLLRSFLRVLDVDLGFRPQGTVAVRIDPSGRFVAPAHQDAHYEEVLRRVRSSRGIDSAGLTDVLPLGFNRQWAVAAKGQAYGPGEKPDAYVRIVSEGYLQAMGISLLAGRDFSSSDDRSGRPVIIVNETMASGLWPAGDPLGQFVLIDDIEREVVGVVRGTHHQALDREPGAEMYLPLRQSSPLYLLQVYLIARGGLSPADLVAAVHDALRPMDSRVALNEVQVLQALVDKSLSPRRFLMLLVTGFAGFALVLASLGIYGVISYSMSQRRQEIGIRMALGASAGALVRDVVTETLKLALIGIVPGLVLSWLLGQSLRGLLFGVTAWDPLTFIGIPLVLIGVAMLAGYLPARRASRLDPVQALRAE